MATPKTSNEELRDALIRHQTYLMRFSSALRNQVWDILDATEQDVFERIVARLRRNTGLTTQVELRRMQALIAQIEIIRQRAWTQVDDLMREELVALSLREAEMIDETVRITMPVQIITTVPSTRLLRAIATSRPFQGHILSEWVDAMSIEDMRRIQTAVQLGMTAGESNETIARRVTGTTTLGGRNGQTELTRRQVQAITRTAVNFIANEARTAFFRQNADIVTQERYVATLDSRTTPICRANDGELYELGKGPIPPLHFNCRSLRIAVIDGTLLGDRPAKPFVERELVSDYARRRNLGDITRRSDLPYGSKGDFDRWKRNRIQQIVGPVPATTTYQTWLKQQSTTFQNDTLGVTKAKLFRQGGLTLDRFVDRAGNELNLAQLARKERDAFIAAGLNPDEF